MSAQPNLRYTLEEYLELDRNSDERLEFWDGEVFSMSGVSDQHSFCPCELSLKEIYRNIKFGAGKNK